MAELTRADIEAWIAELPSMRTHYEKFGDRLPKGLREELSLLEKRLQTAAVGAKI
jgi:phosphoenolpyruvate carboxykinase (GTP)